MCLGFLSSCGGDADKIGCVGVNWCRVAQYRHWRWDFVMTVMNFMVPLKKREGTGLAKRLLAS